MGRQGEEWSEACEDRVDGMHRRLPPEERERIKAACRRAYAVRNEVP
jgi:hypothetical protein